MYNFIVNPNARSGLGQSVWNELETILKKEQIEYQVFFTKYQKHATAIVQDITSDEEESLLAITATCSSIISWCLSSLDNINDEK